MTNAAHGTTSRYRRGCRCRSCGEANTAAYMAWRRHRARFGRCGVLVDAAPTRARIGWLLDQGASGRWIAAQAGLSPMIVSVLRRATADRRTRLTTARKVEALARRVASGDLVPPGQAEAVRRQHQRERRRQYREVG